jgi:hypothetical protein
MKTFKKMEGPSTAREHVCQSAADKDLLKLAEVVIRTALLAAARATVTTTRSPPVRPPGVRALRKILPPAKCKLDEDPSRDKAKNAPLRAIQSPTGFIEVTLGRS